MEDRKLQISNTLSDRKFGLIFSGIFLIISLYFLIFRESFSVILILISFLFFITAVLFPNALNILNKMWFYFGKKLGSLISIIIMFLIYSLTIAPIGLIFKILKKDILKIKIDKSAKSYWIKREEIKSSLKNQF